MTQIIQSLSEDNPFYSCIQNFLKHKNSKSFLYQAQKILSVQKEKDLAYMCKTIQTLWELQRHSDQLSFSDENWAAVIAVQQSIALKMQKLIDANPKLRSSLSENGYLDLE